MQNKPISVAFFDTKPYDREFFGRANARYGLTIHHVQPRLDEETVGLAARHDGVCVFVNDQLTGEVIARLIEQGVRLIALRCAGYNNVDLKAAYRRIHVVRVPAYSPHAVAEHTLALILALNRKTHRAYFRTRDGNFSIAGLMGFDLHGKTAGVIGTGRIGRIVAEILHGFGMEVLLHDPYPDPGWAEKPGLRYVPIEALFKEAHIVTLHCPLTPENAYLINASSLAQMRDGVMLINTGRGKLIHTRDLIEALKSKKVGAAGLDVYEEEDAYFFEDFSGEGIEDDVLARLLSFPNVLVTSHQAFFTAEALTAIADTTLQNIADFFGQEALPNEICYRCGQDTCQKKATGTCF